MRLFSLLVFLRTVDPGVLVRRAYLNKPFAHLFFSSSYTVCIYMVRYTVYIHIYI